MLTIDKYFAGCSRIAICNTKVILLIKIACNMMLPFKRIFAAVLFIAFYSNFNLMNHRFPKMIFTYHSVIITAMLNTTLLLPFPNKSAEPKVAIISEGSFHFDIFKNINQSLKELLLLAP